MVDFKRNPYSLISHQNEEIPLCLMEEDAEDREALPCYSDTLGKSLFLKGACQPEVTWKLESFLCSISTEGE